MKKQCNVIRAKMHRNAKLMWEYTSMYLHCSALENGSIFSVA